MSSRKKAGVRGHGALYVQLHVFKYFQCAHESTVAVHKSTLAVHKRTLAVSMELQCFILYSVFCACSIFICPMFPETRMCALPAISSVFVFLVSLRVKIVF